MTTLYVAVIIALFALGVVYNIIVGMAERAVPDHGYAAYFVVLGTLLTLAGFAALTDLRTAGLALLCFAASGAPMILGSTWRWFQLQQQERQEELRYMKKTAKRALDGD